MQLFISLTYPWKALVLLESTNGYGNIFGMESVNYYHIIAVNNYVLLPGRVLYMCSATSLENLENSLVPIF
jgi:hypothetical protein